MSRNLKFIEYVDRLISKYIHNHFAGTTFAFLIARIIKSKQIRFSKLIFDLFDYGLCTCGDLKPACNRGWVTLGTLGLGEPDLIAVGGDLARYAT
jgi:hypothetical protein